MKPIMQRIGRWKAYVERMAGSFHRRRTQHRAVRRFHELYYYSDVWQHTYWLGHNAYKCPLDLWVYQELLCESRPDVIIECGTNRGGSALFLANICDLIGRGKVTTIDVRRFESSPKHNRITYLKGSSVDEGIVQKVKSGIAPGESALVILDSLHQTEHVLQEMTIYADLVTLGSYLIVEDTNLNGHPVFDDGTDWGSGPAEAVRAFLRNNAHFRVEEKWEKFMMTFNPGGILKRVSR